MDENATEQRFGRVEEINIAITGQNERKKYALIEYSDQPRFLQSLTSDSYVIDVSLKIIISYAQGLFCYV